MEINVFKKCILGYIEEGELTMVGEHLTLAVMNLEGFESDQALTR